MDEDVYKKMADEMSSSVQRAKVTAENMTKLKTAIVDLKSPKDLSLNMGAFYHILRYLRNSCIGCEKNQNLIIDTSLLEDIVHLMTMIYDPLFEGLTNKDDLRKAKTVAIQFLGNLVVQNSDTKIKVWQVCFPTLFFRMMSGMDGEGKDIVCMVIYNCLKDRLNLANNKEERWLLLSVLQHCSSYSNVEWGLLVMELVLTTLNFKILYQELADYPDMRGALLETLLGYLCEDENGSVLIPEENLLYLADQFEAKSSCIIMLANNLNDDVAKECEFLFKILSVLSTATGFAGRYANLRSNCKLMTVSVHLLKQISLCTQPDVSNTGDEHHPLFGLKRYLVRMIGNMCYRNQPMQTYIRELDGIVPILDCCAIDNRNPFIMQWAIFAIRNLCEDNNENQLIISTLENQGVVRDMLGTANVNARLENGKIKISTDS